MYKETHANANKWLEHKKHMDFQKYGNKPSNIKPISIDKKITKNKKNQTS